MKLVDILARELKVWPPHLPSLWVVNGNTIYGESGGFSHEMRGEWPIPEDHKTAIVTQEQWLSAVDELKADKVCDHYFTGMNSVCVKCGHDYAEHEVVEWNGEGLPPVGTVCEYTSNGGLNWRETSILFIDEQVVLLAGYPLYKLVDPDIAFRPIRTPEQIAAEELRKIIESGLDFKKTLTEVVDEIIAAGYRKSTPTDN